MQNQNKYELPSSLSQNRARTLQSENTEDRKICSPSSFYLCLRRARFIRLAALFDRILASLMKIRLEHSRDMMKRKSSFFFLP